MNSIDVTNATNTLLPIAINGHSFKPNDDGLWSLNEIHQALNLDPAKQPSEWRNDIQAELSNSGNLRSKAGRYGGTSATESGAIAYAMWVSTDFYLMVVSAFVAMRNDSILSARLSLLAAAEADSKLAKAIPKADLIDSRLTGAGIPWTQACRLAGINQPQLAARYLVHIQKFVSTHHPFESREALRPSLQGFSGGYFKSCSMRFGNEDGYRVTAKGLVWLQERAQEINAAIAERNRKKAAERRKAAKTQAV
ncbi:KilA-N domain-containing protein [Pseudomonas sp. MPB26]|uniref:KilA-N domain-containing protein n=1 Tax=Pseudomonas sp. MPB26 TaxID=3388491 RepID=UPI0039846AAE